MAALVKYADSDNTKDPDSDEEKSGKGKKHGRGQQQNPTGQSQGNNGKRKHTNGGSDFVANTNAQIGDRRRKGKFQPQFGGLKFNRRYWTILVQNIVVPIGHQPTCGKIVIS